MDICLVPTLEHLSCSKIVMTLLNRLLPFVDMPGLRYSHLPEGDIYRKKFRDPDYKSIRIQVAKDLADLMPVASMRRKLENFIAPLFCELEAWIDTCYQIWEADDDVLWTIMRNIPLSWSTDGVINREKAAKLVVKNGDLETPVRFIFACFYCVYDDILALWKKLTDREKQFLREEYLPKNFGFVVKRWFAWLEGWLNKDWQNCVTWMLDTPLWNMNAYVLRRVLLALSPFERRHYVPKALKALARSGIDQRDNEVIRFSLSVLTREEREVISIVFPGKVIRCMTSWPLRTNFLEIEDWLWNCITPDSFYDILCMLLEQIRQRDRNDTAEILVFLKYFWEKSPNNFRNIIHQRRTRYSPALRYVLDYDLKKVFPIWEYLECYGAIPICTEIFRSKNMSKGGYYPMEPPINVTRQFYRGDTPPPSSRSSVQCCVIL